MLKLLIKKDKWVNALTDNDILKLLHKQSFKKVNIKYCEFNNSVLGLHFALLWVNLASN